MENVSIEKIILIQTSEFATLSDSSLELSISRLITSLIILRIGN
jgi:hypothetical protein